MSTKRRYPIRCPECSRSFEADLYDSVTLNAEGRERDLLLSNRLNLVRCEGCGAEFRIEKPLLVHDATNRKLIYWSPGDTVERAEKQVLEMVTGYAAAVPAEEVPEVRVVLERNELVDKLFVFGVGLDDRAVEYLKYLVASRNPKRIRPDDHDVLFNGLDSTGDELSFLVQNRRTREIEIAFRYGRDAYREVTELFQDRGPESLSLRKLMPGAYVSFRLLLGREGLPLPASMSRDPGGDAGRQGASR